jgi:hypothetical protein
MNINTEESLSEKGMVVGHYLLQSRSMMKKETNQENHSGHNSEKIKVS